MNLLKNKEKGDAQVLAQNYQMTNILLFKKTYFRLYITFNRFLELYIEFFETIEEVKKKALEVLGIPAELHSHFAFYEQLESENFYEETFLNDTLKVTDVLASWEFDINSGHRKIK